MTHDYVLGALTILLTQDSSVSDLLTNSFPINFSKYLLTLDNSSTSILDDEYIIVWKVASMSLGGPNF